MQVTFDSVFTYVCIYNANRESKFLFGFGTNTLLVTTCKSRELIKRIEIYYGLVMNMEYI
jgi:hypothetical protein